MVRYDNQNRKGMIVLSALALVGAFTGALITQKTASAETFTTNASVPYDYTFSFTDYDSSSWSGNSVKWYEDVYESSNVRLSPGQFLSLAPGENCTVNPAEEGQSGYVVYRVVTPSEDKAFFELNLSLIGRSFHYAHADDECCLRVSAKSELADEWTEIDNVPAKETASSSTVFAYSLTEYAQGGKECFVRVEMTGYENDWVALEKIEFSGVLSYYGYEAVKINVEGGNGAQTVSQNGKVAVREATASTSEREYDYTVKVTAPDGTEVSLSNGEFSCQTLGEYTVTYTVNDEGRIYEQKYYVYCVVKAEESGYISGNYLEREKEVFLNLQNYAQDGALTLAGENLRLKDGEAFYLKPLSFARNNFNLTFDVKSLPAGASFDFAFYGAPGAINFDTKTTAGVYFNMKNEGNRLILSAYFADGNSIVSLGVMGYSRITGIHGIGFNRRTISYTDGMACFFDGEEFNSYYMCINVFLSRIMQSDNVYMGYRATKSEVELIALTKADNRTPILSVAETLEPYREYPNAIKVGDTFEFPDAVLYDVVDGLMPYKISVTDPNGKDMKLPEGEKMSFVAEYVGRYSIYYTASDYNGNAVSARKNVTASVKENAPDFNFSKELESSGRVGVSVEFPTPRVMINGKADKELINSATITVTNPLGGEIVRKPSDSFTPFDMGIYTVIYEVTNEYGTAKKYFEINVKANVEAENSYRDFVEAEVWSAKENIASDGNGIKITAPSYCKLPFEMSNGIEVTMDLTGLADKSKIDCWTSLGIGSSKALGDFGSPKSGFMYFMLYFEKGVYYCNGNYCNPDGVSQGLFGPIDMGTTGIVTIGVEKLTGNATMNDNVNIYLNHKRTDYGTESIVSYSAIVDDENFTYLSIGSYGNSSEFGNTDYKSMIIREIAMCDQLAPQFFFDGVNSTDFKFGAVKKGATVAIPSISVEEDFDANFKYTVALYAPSGETVDYASGSFVAESYGSYYLVLKAYDKSGNYNYQIKEIAVEEGNGCSSSVNGTAVGLVLALVALCALPVNNKRRGGERV